MSDRFSATLGNRRWRFVHSVWLFWPIALFGAATAPAFLYVGLRAKQPRWYVPGTVYGIVALIGWVIVGISDEDGTAVNWGVGIVFIGWITGMIHAALINRPWLKWLAEEQWHVSAYRSAATASVSAEAAPAVAALGIEPSAYHAPPAETAPSAPVVRPVDVNTATEAELAALPGMDRLSGQAVLAHRSQVGPFRSIDEFAVIAGIQPHVFASVRSQLTCSSAAPDRGNPGRVLDL